MSGDGRIAIVIASVGRPVELGRWIDHVARQSLAPVEMIWSVVSDSDLPNGARDRPDVPLTIIRSAKGSTVQRNAALDQVRSDPEVVAFFDDDYVPASDCIAGIAKSFDRLPNAVGLSGQLIADGINSSGISHDDAYALISRFETAAELPEYTFRPAGGLYGCNMAFRWADAGQCRFDERLPLYGWQEDWDYAARVAKGRPIGFTDGFTGLHQGVKGGRTSGRRFGYSQVVNPVYLNRKGSMDARKAATLMLRNILANHGKMLRPEPWIDRRGRVRGNWIAIADLLRGRLWPERAAQL